MQRPGIQAAISLDILILRFLAGLIRRAGKLNTDLQVLKQYVTEEAGVSVVKLQSVALVTILVQKIYCI